MLFCNFGCTAKKDEGIKWEFADALIMKNLTLEKCVPPSQQEAELLELAVSVIEHEHADNLNALDIGAQKFLGNGLYRNVDKKSRPVCMSTSLLSRIALALERRNGFGKGRLVEYQLLLAAKLQHPGEALVNSIANSAFATVPQQSEYFKNNDIRPLARSVLASYGRAAAPYAEKAYQEMHGNSPMGTGAAQIAAASGHPHALGKVVVLIDEVLKSVEPGKSIPRAKRNRLYELAWAIAYSGERGRGSVGSIHKIMRMRVESWAPPFGMSDHYPKKMCAALDYLEGQGASAQYSYCNDENIVLDQ